MLTLQLVSHPKIKLHKITRRISEHHFVSLNIWILITHIAMTIFCMNYQVQFRSCVRFVLLASPKKIIKNKHETAKIHLNFNNMAPNSIRLSK